MRLYTQFVLLLLIFPVFSGEAFELEKGTYALKSCSSSGFLDGRNRGEPQMTSIKGDYAEWLIEPYSGGFTIKNKRTSEYLYADNKSDSVEIRPTLVTEKSMRTKWYFIKRDNDTVIIQNIGINGYLDGRHTFDIVYPRILASESHNYTKWLLKRIYQSSNPVKIPNKDLDNGENWHDLCLSQRFGTCTSHAVAVSLAYIHGISGIMPNYIHKYTHFHHGRDTRYEDNGLSINEAMEFVNDFGVPRVPEGMQVEYNTGKPFPKGTTKYTFEGIANVMEASWLTTSGLVNRIKEFICRYQLPVVVSLTSRKGKEVKMNCNFHPTSLPVSGFVRSMNRHIVCTDLSNWKKVDQEIGHALCFYGYDDIREAFYIKNSWGESDWAGRYGISLSGGNALLAYKYVELWGRGAYVGWGTKVISKNLDYEAKRIQMMPNAGGSGGSSFNFSVSSQITSISIRSGWYVDALNVSYANGQTYSYGGNGGSEHKINLGRDEFLTGIKGRAGKYIDNISFITNKRTYGPYGGNGGAPYSFSAPEGYVIDGFYGRSGKFIDAISISLAINN